jgi:ribosomal protein L37AE/L43A
MNPTTQELQRELATLICPQCKKHYSRAAAQIVNWCCEDCDIPLFDADGQKADGKKAA